jgi:hypothetical protein
VMGAACRARWSCPRGPVVTMMGRFEASEGGMVMRRLAATWVLGLLLVCGGSASAVRGEEGAAFPSSDEQLLRRAKMPTDTEGLLA